MSDARRTLVLAIADDELVMGHRLSEWTGWVPYIEEDLALSSIAQDEIGHARALYALAAGDGDLDAIALGRSPGEYRNATICERPNRDFAYTVARHFLYDTADAVRLEALRESSWKELAGLAGALALEETFHLDHARAWVARIGGGPSIEARRRFADALDDAMAEAPALFEPLPDEPDLLAAGVLPVPSDELARRWFGRVVEALAEAGLDHLAGAHDVRSTMDVVPTSSGDGIAETHPAAAGLADRGGPGGRHGRHSEDFEPLWREMTLLYREHPGARW